MCACVGGMEVCEEIMREDGGEAGSLRVGAMRVPKPEVRGVESFCPKARLEVMVVTVMAAS